MEAGSACLQRRVVRQIGKTGALYPRVLGRHLRRRTYQKRACRKRPPRRVGAGLRAREAATPELKAVAAGAPGELTAGRPQSERIGLGRPPLGRGAVRTTLLRVPDRPARRRVRCLLARLGVIAGKPPECRGSRSANGVTAVARKLPGQERLIRVKRVPSGRAPELVPRRCRHWTCLGLPVAGQEAEQAAAVAALGRNLKR